MCMSMGISFVCFIYFTYYVKEFKITKSVKEGNSDENLFTTHAQSLLRSTTQEAERFVKTRSGKRTFHSLSTETLRNIIVHKEEDCPNRRFLIFKCSKGLCGGWGDREKGIVSTFLLALLTNRTFAIIMDKPCDIENFMQPYMYNWTICKRYLSTIPSLDVSEENHVTGGRRFHKVIPEIDFDTYWTKQAVILHMNAYEPVMDSIKIHKNVGDQMKWMINKTNPEIVHLVLRTLLKPKQRLQGQLNSFIGNITQGRTLVCSHIRKGKNPSIPGDNNLPRGSPSENTIFSFLEQFNDVKNYVIYIASDSDDVRKSAQSQFGNVVNINRTIVHVDRLGKVPNTTDLCEGLYTVFFEQQMLSSCDILILTRSNYGTISAYLRGSSEDLYLYQTETDCVMPTNLTNIQHVYRFV